MDNKKATLELGTKPIGKLLAQYAMPAIVAMTAASLYNIIDRIFIGNIVGPLAISGLAITFPFMNLATAFGAAIGVGASTTISVKLGQKDYQSAEHILGNTITLNIIIGIAFGAICLLFLDPILRFFGASDATLPYARSFMEIILVGNVFSHMYFGMNAVLRAASKPWHAMTATIFTVVMNILLDIVFIWWLGWGILGGAAATVLSQIMALCWQMKLFADQRQLLHLKRGIYKLKAHLVKNIVGIGVSPFLMNACACVVIIFINNQLVSYGGDMAVGAFGIANSIAMIFILFVIGLNQGMQPIASYNYGAQQTNRMMRVVKYSIFVATCIMISAWLISHLIPETCARLFTKDARLIEQSTKAMKIYMMVYPIIGYQMVVTNFFQCIGKVRISIFLSLSRQLLFLIPLLIVLPRFFELNGVWASIPTSDVMASTVAAVIMVVYMRRIKQEEPMYKTNSKK